MDTDTKESLKNMIIEWLSVIPAFLFFTPVLLKIRLLKLQSNVGALNTSENQKNVISTAVYHQFLNIGIQIAWAA